MTQRQIFAAAKALLLAAMSLHLQVATVLDSPAWAADQAKPCSVSPDVVRADTLVDKALRAMGGAEEIVFVVRDLCSAYQWYATFGEYPTKRSTSMPSTGRNSASSTCGPGR
jgi:hypothetical protein